MTETSNTTTATTVARTVPAALIALGTHILTHQLPTPIGYRIPGKHDDHTIQLHLSGGDADAWVDSITVDRGYDETPYGSPYAYRHAVGRLPDLGIQVDLFYAVESYEAVTA